MPIHKIQSIYTVVRDMDRMQDFYARGLGLTLRFRDADAWCQFGVGGSNFALSSTAESARGAQGSVPVFETDDPGATRTDIEQAGGRFLMQRDMGAHGVVLTFADVEENLFQVFAKAART
ncbi:VOC family protein [Variovorax boronicumulans]|uniref:VOC family protein n=1 Tax=Variovorax boronicumulans TaxID=436515 RepID=UPI001C56D4AD